MAVPSKKEWEILLSMPLGAYVTTSDVAAAFPSLSSNVIRQRLTYLRAKGAVRRGDRGGEATWRRVGT